MATFTPSDTPLHPAEVARIVQGGSGLAWIDGVAVFIPYTLPGETVTVRVTRVRGDYCEGELGEILRPAPERVTPRCPLFGQCGGCQLQHASQAAQLRYKVEALRETLQRIGKVAEPRIEPPIAAPADFHYRSRAQFKVVGGRIGFYRRRSHRIVSVPNCPLLSDPLNRALAHIRDRLPLQGISEIEIQSNAAGEILTVLKGQRISEAGCRRFYDALKEIGGRGVVAYTGRRRRVFGADALIYTVRGKTLRVSDRSFFQINPSVNPLLIETALAWAAPAPSDEVLELYSGVGNFTLPFAESARQVTAVESHPAAMRDAQWNLAQTRLSNVTLLETAVEEALASLSRGPRRFAVVFLDPPREGLSAAALTALCALSPGQILYLSCNPATLARDLRAFGQGGYSLHRLVPFEMFPQTAHLEALAELHPI